MPDYDKMPAGRDMDALITEKIMGWKRIPTPGHWKCKAEYALLNESGPDDPFCPKCMDFPRRSTEIEAAWPVVEEMRERGFLMFIGPSPDNSSAWAVQCKRATENVHELTIAGTAPLAICRAALKAVDHA